MNETTLLTKSFEKVKSPSLLIKETLDKAFEESAFMQPNFLNGENMSAISLSTSEFKSLPNKVKNNIPTFTIWAQKVAISLIDLKLTKNPKNALLNSIYKAFCHNYYYYAVSTVKHYVYPFNHESKQSIALKLNIKDIKTRKLLSVFEEKFNKKNKNKKLFLFSDTNIFSGDSLSYLNFAVIKISDLPTEIQKLPKEVLYDFMQELFKQSKYVFGHICIFVEDKFTFNETAANNIKESLYESLMQSLFENQEIVEYSVLLEKVKQNNDSGNQKETVEIASVRLNHNYEIKFKINKNYLKIKEFNELQNKINKVTKDSMQLVQEYILKNPSKKIPNYKIELSTERLKDYIKCFLIESGYILKQIKEI